MWIAIYVVISLPLYFIIATVTGHKIEARRKHACEAANAAIVRANGQPSTSTTTPQTQRKGDRVVGVYVPGSVTTPTTARC